MLVGLEVEYHGWASWLSRYHRKNLWHGSAPFGRAARQSYGVALAYWHEVVLPRHFAKNTQQKYGYRRRKAPYRRIKRRLAQGLPVRGRYGHRIRGREARVIKGGLVSIVRSGQTERQARAASNIRTTPSEGVLTMRVPHYITQRSKMDRPKQGQEITTVPEGEVREVSRVAHREFFRELHAEGRRARSRRFVIPPGKL